LSSQIGEDPIATFVTKPFDRGLEKVAVIQVGAPTFQSFD
jgi:hypothetical protein